MFWHLLLSEQREQLGRQLLRCLGRQPIAVFAKARDRRQRRGKGHRQHKRTEYRGADHCCTGDVEPLRSEYVDITSYQFLHEPQKRTSANVCFHADISNFFWELSLPAHISPSELRRRILCRHNSSYFPRTGPTTFLDLKKR